MKKFSFLFILALSSCTVYFKSSDDPSRQHLKTNGEFCYQNSECRSDLCLHSHNTSACFEQYGNSCLPLSAETSLPLSVNFDLTCPVDKPKLQVCGFEVNNYFSSCDRIKPLDPNINTGGFKFYCCPNR
jgi:hypothetical protein